jgi:hypothetical protein
LKGTTIELQYYPHIIKSFASGERQRCDKALSNWEIPKPSPSGIMDDGDV